MLKNQKILDKISKKLYGEEYLDLDNDERKNVLNHYPTEKEIKEHRFITAEKRILGKNY